MLTTDQLADKLSSSVAVAALSGLVVLPLAWRLLHAATYDSDKSHVGTRKVVRPATTLPLLGNTLDVIKNLSRRHDWIANLCEAARGEPVLIQSLGTQDMTVLSTPQAFEDVFKNQFDNFPKGPKKTEFLHELLGEGIFAVATWLYWNASLSEQQRTMIRWTCFGCLIASRWKLSRKSASVCR
ncbi:unnamed protein product [Phytophthora fragariaefolia]|uniref:Unnamed protein product n=1 Tax=Phytophthora fragariaefolia TaxID=1490495 RepID=A0A9W6Y747_9STRA|nr:unnamed protein product [Phytophthora fragariaefolia]